jgi:hypothetical protein
MQLNSDFKDLLKLLNDYEVRYLIVGGYAVMYHSEPRFTKDIDIWIDPTPENAIKVWNALADFGAPLEQVNLADFYDKELIYQIGVAPNRIDIIMDVPGTDFQQAWQNCVKDKYGDEQVFIIGLDDLINAKKKSGREQDLIDVKYLENKTK